MDAPIVQTLVQTASRIRIANSVSLELPLRRMIVMHSDPAILRSVHAAAQQIKEVYQSF
jgi:hypothetical protein